MIAPIELKYPVWMRYGIWFGVLMFFGMAVFFFAMAYQALVQKSVLGVTLMTAFGALIFYLAMAGKDLLPYLRCIIRVDELGFDVISDDQENHYSWSRPFVIRNRKSVQILEVFDSNEQRIVAIDHMVPNFEQFRARLERVSQ